MPSIAAPILDLSATLSCGQAFRWKEAEDGWWCGVVDGRVLRVRHVSRTLEFEGEHSGPEVGNYFSLDHDLPAIYEDMLAASGNDETLFGAIEEYRGLRLLRQEPWEALATFIVSANNNISRITGIIEGLARRFGEPIGGGLYAFPSPAALGRATLAELMECGTGYRAGLLQATSNSVCDGLIDFQELKRMPVERARKELLRKVNGRKVLPGVGEKVADCVLLFGLEFLSTVPVDVNVYHLWSTIYAGGKGRGHIGDTERGCAGKKLTPWIYGRNARDFKNRFGDYSGYAQQYLFHWWRNR